MIRGTTPTMSFGLPFETDELATGYVTVMQDDVTVIEKPLSECELEGRVVEATFTQEESLKLTAGIVAKFAVVAKTVDGNRMESLPYYEDVEETSKDGVI